MTKKELIASAAFDKALDEGAQYKKDMMTSYKAQNKSTYNSFYEVMLDANEDIKRILDIKKKNRTPDDIRRVNEFKQTVRAMYWQVQNLSLKENLEEGQKSKYEKIVARITPVIKILRYIGDSSLDDAFKKAGLSIVTSALDEDIPALKASAKKTAIAGILKSAVSVKQKVADDNDHINVEIYQTKVPIDLQYDKKMNNVGLKTGDWRKLVDLKAKLLVANSQEAKDHVDEKIEQAASNKQFEVARAELVRDKLTKLQ